MRGSKVRIGGDCLFQKMDRDLIVGLCLVVKIEASSQQVVIGSGINRFRRGEPCFFLWCQLDLDGLCHSTRYLVLQQQNIAKLAIVSLRPQMLIRLSIDQLDGYLDTVAKTLD